MKDLVDRIQDLETRLEASQSRSTGPTSVEFDDAHRFDVNVQLQQSGLAWENEQGNARSIDQVSKELGALSLGHADMMAQYYGKRKHSTSKQRLILCQSATLQVQGSQRSSSAAWTWTLVFRCGPPFLRRRLNAIC